MQKIGFLDLKQQYLSIKDEVWAALNDVMENTAFSGGPFVEKFEKHFSEWNGSKHTLGISNGTIALQMAFQTLGIGPGDEVIVPANTFIATAWGVSHAGGTPVFVDCDPDTWEIDPAKIEAAITPSSLCVSLFESY